jgi:hypothetical protein
MRAILFNKITSNAHRYWPMQIAEGDSDTGFQIGGMPPVDVKPKLVTERTQYFGTFPISGIQDGELSIFCSFDYTDINSSFLITRHIHKPVDQSVEVIQCVFHPSSRQGKDSTLASDLNGYAVNVGPEALDIEDEKGWVPHKIGGIAFLYPKFKGISVRLQDAGYFHLLQWVFPGKGDCAVKGEWPFADYHFHLFAKKSKGGYDYRTLLV